MQTQMNVLGPFELFIDGQRVAAFRTGKMRALLVYMALEGPQDHNRQELAALLWPESSAKMAGANLRKTLSRLRHALNLAVTGAGERLLETTRHRACLRRDMIEIDLLNVQALLATITGHSHQGPALYPECIANLEEAVALYRGEMVAGLSIADAPIFDEWLTMQRERASTLAQQALAQLATAYEASGEYAAAEQHAHHLLELNPYQEATQRQCIRLKAYDGDRSEALRLYERFRRRLADDLGIAPDVKTRTLVEEIRRGKFSRAATSSSEGDAVRAPVELASQPAEFHTSNPLHDILDVGLFFGRQYDLGVFKMN